MALTVPPDFADGILTAAKLQALSDSLLERTPRFARKTSDETVNTSAVLQADDQLTLPVDASVTYEFWLHLLYNSNATADLSISMALPAGASCPSTTFVCAGTGAAIQHGLAQFGTNVTGVDGLATDAVFDMWGALVMSTTPGNFALSWAQTTSNASNTTIRAGSYLRLQRMV